MARKKKHHEEAEKENSERWLLTYSDMITLLMLFFIVLYSMSNVDQKKYEQLSQGLAEAFSGGNFGFLDMTQGSKGMLPGAEKAVIVSKEERRTKLRDELKDYIKGNGISMMERSDGIMLTIAADLYFGTASSEISDSGYADLRSLAGYLTRITEDLRIEGHTDNVPIEGRAAGGDYASNWDLSSKRALSVLEVLASYGVPESRLSALAYGSSRPIRSNETPEGRAANRRVDIVVLYDDRFSQGAAQ